MFFYQVIQFILVIARDTKAFMKNWSVAVAFEMAIEATFMVSDGYSKEDAVQVVVWLQNFRNEFGIPVALSKLVDYFEKFADRMNYYAFYKKKQDAPSFNEIFHGFLKATQRLIPDIIASTAVNLNYELDYVLDCDGDIESYDSTRDRLDWAWGKTIVWDYGQFDWNILDFG